MYRAATSPECRCDSYVRSTSPAPLNGTCRTQRCFTWHPRLSTSSSDGPPCRGLTLPVLPQCRAHVILTRTSAFQRTASSARPFLLQGVDGPVSSLEEPPSAGLVGSDPSLEAPRLCETQRGDEVAHLPHREEVAPPPHRDEAAHRDELAVPPRLGAHPPHRDEYALRTSPGARPLHRDEVGAPPISGDQDGVVDKICEPLSCIERPSQAGLVGAEPSLDAACLCVPVHCDEAAHSTLR